MSNKIKLLNKNKIIWIGTQKAIKNIPGHKHLNFHASNFSLP
jgi:hypothetical protein